MVIMNISEVVTSIQMDIGIYKIALPFDEPVEKVLTDVIQIKTVPVFSLLHPLYEKMRFNLGELEVVERGSNYTTYLLPDVFNNRKILFIKRVEYADNTVTGLSYFGGFPMSGGLVNQSMIANASAKLAAKMIPKITHHWEAPRKLTIYNAINSCEINVEIAFPQDKSLITIEDTCYDSFLDLATLDCKKFLYESLKHYPELNSAYGNIALKIEDWQQADDNRKQLLEQWNNTYHLDQVLYEFI